MSKKDDKTFVDVPIQDVARIKKLDDTINKLMTLKDSLEELKEYKLGDIYIQEVWNSYNKKPRICENHLGFPLKFQVVHVSECGVPYLRQLNSKGKPIDGVMTPPHKSIIVLEQLETLESMFERNYRYVPDPAALDAILLGHEFDPMAPQREVVKLSNEIIKHNKAITIQTGWDQGWENISEFFKGLTPGDKFWTSIDKCYIFQGLKKVGKQWEITALDQSQTVCTFAFRDFNHKRLYSAQPRSFAKEKKT